MEHLSEPLLFLKECRRVLCKNGNVILSTPFIWGIHEAPHDYYRYTEYGLKYLLNESGFRDINVIPNSGYWITAGLRLNYHLNRYKTKLSRPFLIILFKIIQKASIHFDRIDFNPSDAVSYTTIAQK
jgi:hypothetical protein